MSGDWLALLDTGEKFVSSSPFVDALSNPQSSLLAQISPEASLVRPLDSQLRYSTVVASLIACAWSERAAVSYFLSLFLCTGRTLYIPSAS